MDFASTSFLQCRGIDTCRQSCCVMFSTGVYLFYQWLRWR